MTENTNAYTQGYAAYQTGWSVNANLYDPNREVEQFDAWIDGWCDARHDAKLASYEART